MGLFDFLKKDGNKEEKNKQLLQYFYEEDELNELLRDHPVISGRIEF